MVTIDCFEKKINGRTQIILNCDLDYLYKMPSVKSSVHTFANIND